MRSILLFITFLLFPLLSAGQNVSGIPVTGKIQGKRIMDFAEDEDGYVWLGTDHGLFRHNGSASIPYYAEGPGTLTSDFILSLCPDTDHRLWVGTDKGICLIQDGKVAKTSPYGADFAFSLYNYSDSTLLFSTQDALYTYHKKSGEQNMVLREPDYAMPRFIRNTGDYLWLYLGNNRKQATVYDTGFHLHKTIPIPDDSTASGLAFWDGSIYLATTRGLFRFAPDGSPRELPASLKPFEKKFISFCRENPRYGTLLLGVSGEGIRQLHPGQEDRIEPVWQNERLEPDTYYKVLPTASTLWLYQWEKELRVLYAANIRNSLPLPDINWGEVLTHMMPGQSDDEAFLVTTSGVYGFHVGSETFHKYMMPYGKKIRSALRTGSGDVVVLDRESELYRLRYDQGRWMLLHHRAANLPEADIWEDYEGNICAIRNGILYWICSDGKSGTKELDGIPVEGRPSKGPDGRLYFIGGDSVYQLDFGYKFVRLPVTVPHASCCLWDTEGNLFIGSMTDGMFLYRFQDGSIRHFDSRNGLPDKTVQALSTDSAGNLWISTRNYVAHLSKKDYHISVQDYSSDFPQNYSRFCALSMPHTDAGERVLFGCDQSISIVNPSQAAVTRPIPLSLDAVLVNNQLLDTDAPMDAFPHDWNQWVFYYSGMDFQKSAQLNYSYCLDGYDKDWISVGRNLNARYSNLPAGKYVFRVRVYAPDGNPSPDEIAFPFRIKPAPWVSWPAVLVYVLLSILLLGSLLRYYLFYLQTREKELLAEADRALAESENLGNAEEAAYKSTLTGHEKEFMDKMRDLVGQHLSEESFNATVLAEELGMSYTRFYLKVKELSGQTPQEYLTDIRLSKARELLASGEFNVSEVCYQVGFSSLPGFSRSYKKRFGIPPSETRPK